MMDQLEWSECGETLDDVLKNPRVQLPQVIKLSTTLSDINTKEKLEKGELLIIHSKETIQQFQAKVSGSLIQVPFECPHKIRRKVTPGKEKVFETITDVAKTEPLPRFVEVKDVGSTTVDTVSNGDRLKVVIVEKAGGVPSFIHFRNSAGKHIKLSAEENISFQLSVNDGSEQLISNLSQKSKEFPVSAEFMKKKELPKSYSDLDIFSITDIVTEEVVIASAVKKDQEYGIIFPLNSNLKFQVNSKLKMAKDEDYRELCTNASNVNAENIKKFISHHDPKDTELSYVVKYKELLKTLKFDYSEDSDSDSSPKIQSKLTKKQNEKESKKIREGDSVKEKQSKSLNSEDDSQKDNEEELPTNTLVVHSEQKEILKREIKEKERQAKLEKDRLKAEKKKEKKEKKEKEKEEKKKKKKLSSSSSIPSSPIEVTDDDLYILPQSLTEEPSHQTETDQQPTQAETTQQSQLAMYLMNKVKKVRDRTQTLGSKKTKKRGRLRKEDIEYVSSDQLGPSQEDKSFYTGLGEEDFTESLYEALPGDMAYESLDLVAQAQRSLTVPIPTENSGDSGFDEIDQARIEAWRDAMAPPPLPGNHPMQQKVSETYDDDNIYEMAVDTKNVDPAQNMAAWQNFYDSVQQSTNEISSWDMEDVAKCLGDLKLSKYTDTFSDSQVDGQLLLDLDESVLLDLGLTAFEARKLRKFVFGWRPDVMRPQSYPVLKGFDSKDPSDWSQADVVAHLKIIEIDDLADFCNNNQVNGELLKDICVDESIISIIITTKDRKLKSVKIKNYVIDQWRPKKKGEGNYVSSNSILPPEKRMNNLLNNNKSKEISPKIATKIPKVTGLKRSPHTQSKNNENFSGALGVNKKGGASDAPLIAKMKQQLEENKNSWEQKTKKPVQYI